MGRFLWPIAYGAFCALASYLTSDWFAPVPVWLAYGFGIMAGAWLALFMPAAFE